MQTPSTIIPWLWRVPLIPLIIIEFLALIGLFTIPVDFTMLGLFISSTVAFLLFEIVYDSFLKKRDHRLHWWAIVPAVLIIFIDAGGDMLHFYSRYDLYDAVLHLLGPFALAAVLYDIYRAIYPKSSRVLMALFAATSSISFAVIYEIEEYLEDWYFHSNRFGDKWDTGNDLLMDVIGAGALFLIVVLNKLFFEKKAQHARNHREDKRSHKR